MSLLLQFQMQYSRFNRLISNLGCLASGFRIRSSNSIKKFNSLSFQIQSQSLFSTSILNKELSSKLGNKWLINYKSPTYFSASSAYRNNESVTVHYRFYSKSKDRPKSGKTQHVIKINENEMQQLIDVQSFKTQLGHIIEEMKKEYINQLNIRGVAGTLETLLVEFDGEKYPLQELAQVGRKNPQLAVLNFGALPEAGPCIMKAIQESGMNVNPQQEGTTIYIPLPKVTREHREGMAKSAKAIFHKFKLLLQAAQNKQLKKVRGEDVSEDLKFSVTQQIMKMTENYIAEAEALMHAKQKELLDS